MARPRAALSTFLLTALLLLGCDGDPTGPGPVITKLPRALTAAEEAVIEGSNTFALGLLREVRANQPDSPNVFLSPLSASMALGMTMNGTDGETRTQMREVLGFGGLDEPEINEAYRDLIALLLELDPRVTFGLGNSIWARKGIPFYETFYDRVTTYFEARAEELDFADPGAPDVINGWVEDVTRGRITEMVDVIPPEAIMYLINAVFFKGDWRQQFDPARTADRPFHRTDGSSVTVPMMSIAEGGFRTFRTETAMGVELPYGADAFTAVAVLPDPGYTIDDLVAGVDTATWAAWMTQLDAAELRQVVLELPRFELDYERILDDDLEALGMVNAFYPALADFARLTPLDEVYVSEVKQKTFVKVDEEGTEAAAATSVEIVRVVSGPPTYRFDRPFLFAIRERLSGTILFIGVIGDPS